MRSLCICILVLSSKFMYGQSIINSPYSVYGPGMFLERMSTLNSSMGGTGYGVQHHDMVNYMNPASYVSIGTPVSHMFDIGMYTEQNQYTTSKQNEGGTAGG